MIAVRSHFHGLSFGFVRKQVMFSTAIVVAFECVAFLVEINIHFRISGYIHLQSKVIHKS